LKTWPIYFAAVLDGSKTFELRRDDRGFTVGNVLRLEEWDPRTQEHTGRSVDVVVTYVAWAHHLAPVGKPLADGFVCMGIRPYEPNPPSPA
jgi:hypothetical protein